MRKESDVGKGFLKFPIKIIFNDNNKEYTESLEEDEDFKNQCKFVQFHPSYDYTDFVEGLRPIKDSNGNDINLNNNQFTMPYSNVTINANFKPIEYQFTEGENATYQDNDLIFKLDSDASMVEKVLVNGKELLKNFYTVENGSTIITLKNDYLKTLSPGSYNLTINYTNGTSTMTTFTIPEKENINVSSEESNSNKAIENKVNNPDTSDNILLYVILLIGAVIVIIITSASLKKNKKKRKKRKKTR